MKKRTLVVMVVALSLSLVAAGSAFARWGGGYGVEIAGYERGYGGCDAANCYRDDVDPQVRAKFIEETQAFREELRALNSDLRAEYEKDSPDADRIAQLRKDRIDVETKIHKVADKYEIGPVGKSRRARGGYGRGCF